jgi:hypothetical protein
MRPPYVLPPAAAELVSDVANGGQVLIDEPTFLLVKDSLSLLGTVSEAGYDDRMLQRLNQARVVGRLQQQVACAGCLDRWAECDDVFLAEPGYFADAGAAAGVAGSSFVVVCV